MSDWTGGFPVARPEPLRTLPIQWDRVRPVEWLWDRRIPLGKLSLLVSEESGGKGTLEAWLAVAVMRGDLFGDRHGTPQRVLIIGDEDGLEDTWIPRLLAAGATRTEIESLLVPVDPAEVVNLAIDHARLTETIRHHHVGWVVFDQLLDHIDGGRDGAGIYNPKHIRDALKPLRYVARDTEVAITGNLHPIKGSPKSFRDLIGGSHQFNAVARASLWLGPDPDSEDPAARVLVRGKGNLSAEPPCFEFKIVSKIVDFGDFELDQPTVFEPVEGVRHRRDFEGGTGFGQGATTPAHERAVPAVLARLGTDQDKAATISKLADEIGISRNTLSKTLKLLREQGLADQINGDKGPWVLAATPPINQEDPWTQP